MRRRALGKNVDDVLGPRRQRRCFWQQRRLGLQRVSRRRQQFVPEHGGQTQGTKAHARALEKLAARQKTILKPNGVFLLVFIVLIHSFGK